MVGAYTDKPFVRITHIYVNHRIIKSGGEHFLREYGNWSLLDMKSVVEDEASRMLATAAC